MMLQFLTAQAPKGDPIALLLVLLIVVIFAEWVFISKRKKKKAENAPAPTCEAVEAPGSAGKVKLYDVEPKTAAMIMAIVAEQTGKPLNELRFISIKEVE